MTEQHIAPLWDLRNAVVSTPGDTPSSLRTSLIQKTAQLCNSAPAEGGDIPAELESYVKKVALSAYRVTDQDIERLREHGYSEDALFEITLSVAVGTGISCLAQSMAALKEAEETPACD